MAVATVALAAGLLAARSQIGEMDASRIELSAFASRASAAALAPSPQSVDFTATLPQSAPMEKLLRETFRTAAQVGVSVVSAEPQDAQAQAPGKLAHAKLSLRLTGPYPGIKTLLGELLARFPGLAVHLVRIQRAPGNAAGIQDATIVLQQWLRPRSLPQASADLRG